MPKNISTQVKLIGFLVVALLIPIGLANFIFYKARDITGQLNVMLAVKNLQKQNESNMEFLTYLQSVNAKLDKLVSGIKNLEFFSRVFLIASLAIVPLAAGAFWLFLATITNPMREVLSKLYQFRNEDKSFAEIDFFQTAAEFDRFLQTSQNILSETRSIAQELIRKIEPMTNMAVFSDDNVSHFFTDVQEISRSSNYVANTVEATTASIEEVSTSAQTIADRSMTAAKDSSGAANVATSGRQAVTETIGTMESIKDEVMALEDLIENLNSEASRSVR